MWTETQAETGECREQTFKESLMSLTVEVSACIRLLECRVNNVLGIVLISTSH